MSRSVPQDVENKFNPEQSNPSLSCLYRGNTRNGLSEREIEILLSVALEQGGDFAEIYLECSKGCSLELSKGVLEANHSYLEGVGIRVICEEKTGYSYSNDLSFSKLKEAARSAARIARGAQKVNIIRLIPTEAPSYSPIIHLPSKTSLQSKVALMKRAESAAYRYDSRIKNIRVHYDEQEKEIQVANSEGLLITDHQTLFMLYMRPVAQENGRAGQGWAGDGGRIGMELFQQRTPEELAAEASDYALVRMRSIEAPAGMLPVVLAAGCGGILFHEAIGHSLEADRIRSGSSMYTGRLGQKVASELCTLVDDATIPHQRGTINIDDEGTPGQRKVLIENGILKKYMYDKFNAMRMGTASTGNGRRQSYRYVPLPRMTNMFLDAGEDDPEDIIKSVPKGIYVKHIGAGSMNPTSGIFTFTVSNGYLIESGKITYPIKGATLIGNAAEILYQVTRVGADLEFGRNTANCGRDGQGVPASTGSPTVKIAQMTIGGTVV